MQETSNEIKDRMLKSASKMWGGNETASGPSFDPLVGMLISACAFELENLSSEIDETRLRVSENLIDMMVPDVNSGALPAHALVTSRAIENEVLATFEDSFYVNADFYEKTPSKPFAFSPAGNFKVINGSIKGMLHCGGYYEMGYHSTKSEEVYIKNIEGLEPDIIWFAFDLPEGISEIKDLSLYFNCRKNSDRHNFYSFLRNSSWYGCDSIIEVTSGFSESLSKKDFLYRIFGKGSIRHNSYLEHVRKFYHERFVTLDLRKEHLISGIPEQFKDLFTTLSPKEYAEKSSLIWIKLKFPQSLNIELLDDLICMTNTFPVVNLNKVSKIFKSRKCLNLFALKDENAFFDLESVEDSDGTFYRESRSDKLTDIEENFFVLRGSGVESFDSRKASEHISYLLEKLKNESASFSFLDKTAFNGDLLKLSQIIARLELNQENLPNFLNTIYLYLNTKKENFSIFVKYHNTSGDLANGLKPGTALRVLKGSQFAQASVRFLTSSVGGRSKMTREDRVNTFKKALLTRDRIVTEEDIKSFCSLHFGKYVESIKIKKGVKKNYSAKGSFERTIDLYLDLKSTEIIHEHELNFLCRDFLIILENHSSNIFPFQLFINNNLMEA